MSPNHEESPEQATEPLFESLKSRVGGLIVSYESNNYIERAVFELPLAEQNTVCVAAIIDIVCEESNWMPESTVWRWAEGIRPYRVVFLRSKSV